MRLKKAFYWWSSAAILCMIMIFIFSAMSADDSSVLSESLTMRLFGNPDLETPVRKAAHLLMYTFLGFFAANSFKYISRGKKAYIAPLCFASFYAVTDELHQLFVPGRSCELRDWAIDTLGALLGICIAFLIIRRKKPDSA